MPIMIQSLRAAENFPITQYPLNSELIRALAMVKKAAALANMKTKRLYEGLGNVIVQAANEIIEGKFHDDFYRRSDSRWSRNID